MAVMESFSKHRINRVGVFDLKELYKGIKGYLNNLKYTVYEQDNQTKIKSKGNEIIVELEGDRKVDDYVKFWLNVHIFIIEAKHVKIKGKDLLKGNLQITIKSDYELDYENKWVHSKFADLMHKFYRKHIIKDKINTIYEGKIYGEVINLLDLIKEILDLYKQ